MRKLGPHCYEMELRGGQCGWGTALLRRGPCPGLHQQMVRIRVLAAEAGLSEVLAVEVNDMNCNSSSQLRISQLATGFVSVSEVIKNGQWVEENPQERYRIARPKTP
jgi:hypothetical protein